jgi:hypothetical protein
MRSVVHEIVDDPTRFPGVVMAKLAGPANVGARSDSLVIYLTDQAAAQGVVRRLRSLQAASPAAFQRGAPAMTEQVLEGVSLGSEPLRAGGQSFGRVRSNAINAALRESVERGETREQFMERAFEALRQRGVSPEAPHLNLPQP